MRLGYKIVVELIDDHPYPALATLNMPDAATIIDNPYWPVGFRTDRAIVKSIDGLNVYFDDRLGRMVESYTGIPVKEAFSAYEFYTANQKSLLQTIYKPGEIVFPDALDLRQVCGCCRGIHAFYEKASVLGYVHSIFMWSVFRYPSPLSKIERGRS